FSFLKEHNYKICVASNAVSSTIRLCLDRLGIKKFVNTIISNEDVKLPKPSSEMYLKCMIQHGVDPVETLIVEDSYYGRLAVHNSGAYLCPVENSASLTLELITSKLNNHKRMKWKDN